MTDPRDEPHDWKLADEVGGVDELHDIVDEFYRRVFDDPLIGFLFASADRETLVEHQVEWIRAHLGAADVVYTGESIRSAHESLPITVGHFDRREEILRDVLMERDVPDHVREAWLELDADLRDFVVRTGEEAREEMLEDPE